MTDGLTLDVLDVYFPCHRGTESHSFSGGTGLEDSERSSTGGYTTQRALRRRYYVVVGLG